MMPVPSHLRGIAFPRDSVVDEDPLTADIRCSCRERTLALLYPGQTHRQGAEIIPCTAQIDGRYFFILDFVDQAGEEFSAEVWPAAFGWFDLDTICVGCGKASSLVSYETM